jgi:hypothetical protein
MNLGDFSYKHPILTPILFGAAIILVLVIALGIK